ncbi:hypothetical protein LZ012_13730 [Dechloromonas sp. XY25]|uniref:Uncharacterized protein n=1 Tax=Dechloromonas hankyongensis TaxID=2908002 RepID=A0ABS9K4H3_9RHOO|nr:hypothetical protein [Dechloromonas hankyongensis]MCG2578050.1 hypothetical protein [Dechloromonas hankyongensis]
MKRKSGYQSKKIAMTVVAPNERIRRMQSYLARTEEKFKEVLQLTTHLGTEANGVLAGPAKRNKKQFLPFDDE